MMGAWNDKLLMLELISQSYYITPRGLQGVKKDGFFRYDETPNPLGQWGWLLKKPGPDDGICDPDGNPYPAQDHISKRLITYQDLKAWIL